MTTAARLHGADEACNNFTGHTGSDGSTAGDRLLRQGYAWTWVGEDLYWGQSSTPIIVVAWWMNSQPHRDNILSPNYTSMGVGYVFLSSSTYKLYWIVDFARP